MKKLASVGNNPLVIAMVFATLIFSFGCQPKEIYKEIKTIEDGVWHHDQILNFETEIDDNSGIYNVGLFVDHVKSYPFENLYIRFSHDESGEILADTITMDLVGQDGYFRGDCNSENCNLEKILLSKVRFQNTGKQSFSLEQFTRSESLEGINEIGLFIRKATTE